MAIKVVDVAAEAEQAIVEVRAEGAAAAGKVKRPARVVIAEGTMGIVVVEVEIAVDGEGSVEGTRAIVVVEAVVAAAAEVSQDMCSPS